MRPLRPLARLAGGLLLLAGAACIADPPAAPGGGTYGLALRVAASLQDGTRLRVRVGYVRPASESIVEVPVSPATFSPAGFGVEQPVVARIAPCFTDGLHDGDEGPSFCVIAVELSVLEADEVVASDVQYVNVRVGEPGPIRVPTFRLLQTGVVGVVRDAETGNGVPGAQVRLFEGSAATGPPVATAVAGSDGSYQLVAGPGTYVVQATAPGYIESTFGPVTVGGAQPVAGDVVISRTLGEGETRVVLTWGASPRDLDSHLFGPSSARAFHIYFAVRNVLNPAGTAVAAQLDVDETEGFGPETITIFQQTTGTYRYAVHDFTNADASTGSALAASGARVRVYRGSALVAEFTPPNQPGTYWTVFDLNGTAVTPVNTMAFVATPAHPGQTLGAQLAPAPSGARAAAATRKGAP